MSQSQGDLGNQFPGSVADQITVELHDQATYPTTVYSTSNIDLTTTGLASVAIPAAYGNNYYITVKHRNSIETVSSSPVAFSAVAVNYDFTTSAAQAFGNNLKNIGGIYVLFSGDVNQDGIIDISDMIDVDNLSTLASSGYLPSDVNGDGLIDISDMIIIDNNSSQAIGTITP